MIAFDLTEPKYDAVRFSNFGEQHYIDYVFETVKNASPEDILKWTDYVVDIGARDGIDQSNTCQLFRKRMPGLCLEYDKGFFFQLAYNFRNLDAEMACVGVTPENVVGLLDSFNVPEQPLFLNIDTDGYDWFVLERILSAYRPLLICTEVNLAIPPPVKFSALYSNDFKPWTKGHFYGQSISKVNELTEMYDYRLVNLHYNNAFLMPVEICPFASLTPMEAFRDGYWHAPKRLERFPWNEEMDYIVQMTPQDAVIELTRYFNSLGRSDFECYL